MIYLVSPNEKKMLRDAGDRYPLGITYVGAYLRDIGERVKLFDLNHTSYNEFINAVHFNKPDLIGFSFMTPSSKSMIELNNYIKKSINIETLAGGVHPSAMPEEMSKYFDYVVVGEGELDLRNLNKGINKGADNTNLNLLPLPARDLLDNNYDMIQHGKRTGTLISSRGCSYSCSFCSNTAMGKKVRLRSVNNVLSEVGELVEKYKYEALYFLDDLFTIDKVRTEALTKGISYFNIPYRITTRANLLNEDIIRLLKESNCDIISFGVESGNNNILKNINKKETIEMYEDKINLCSKYKILTKAFFIIGLPGETRQTVMDTINYSKKLKKIGLTTADFYILTPFPGSDIYYNTHNYDLKIIDREYDDYLQASKNGAKSHVETSNLKKKDLEELLILAKGEFLKC